MCVCYKMVCCVVFYTVHVFIPALGESGLTDEREERLTVGLVLCTFFLPGDLMLPLLGNKSFCGCRNAKKRSRNNNVNKVGNAIVGRNDNMLSLAGLDSKPLRENSPRGFKKGATELDGEDVAVDGKGAKEVRKIFAFLSCLLSLSLYPRGGALFESCGTREFKQRQEFLVNV